MNKLKIIQDTFSLIDLVKIYNNRSYFTNEYNTESDQITCTQVPFILDGRNIIDISKIDKKIKILRID
jgi:hypothetical protein